MKIRITAWIIFGTLLLAAGGAVAWSWLLHTEHGAAWLFSRLQASVAGSLEAGALGGDLASGLTLKHIRFSNGELQLDVESLTIAADIGLLPPAVRLEAVQADRPVLSMLQESGETADWGTVLSELTLPLPIEFHELSVSNFEWIPVSGRPVLTLESIEAAGSLHRELILDLLSVRQAENRLEVSVRLGLLKPHPLSAELRTVGLTSIQANLRGSLATAGIELTSRQPEISARGTLRNLLDTPGWDLELSAPGLTWPIDDPNPELRLDGMEARTTGTWPDYRVELGGQFEWESLGPSRLEMAGEGTGEQFTAQKVSLDGTELALEATAEISWTDRPFAEFEATLIHLDPAAWLDEWPENHLLEGRIKAAWSKGQLSIPNFALNLRNLPSAIGGEAVVDTEEGIVDGKLDWRDFRWPPDADTPAFSSESGALSVYGRPEAWKLDGGMDIQAADLPRGQLRLSGSGDLASLEVRIHEGSVLGGLISGDLAWNWTGSQPFSVALMARDIDIGPVVPQFPGSLSANLAADGELMPFRLDLDVLNAEGEFKAQTFQARGGFHVEGGAWRAEQLTLALGPSSIMLDGNPFLREGIVFITDIDSLGMLDAQLDGSLSGRGVVSLHPDSPSFSADVTGVNLAWGDISVQQFELQDRTENGRPAGIDLELTGLSVGERPIDFVRIGSSGREPLKYISIEAQAEGTGMTLDLSGSVGDWENPLDSGWSGMLSGFRLKHREQYALELEEAADLEISPLRFFLRAACLHGTGDARMCVDASWLRAEGANLAVTLASLPLNVLEQLIDTELEFSQILSGHLRWSQSGEGAFTGGARIEMSPGSIRVEDDDELAVQTGTGLFGFELAEGQLREGDLDFRVGATGIVDIDFSVPDLAAGLQSPVQGRAQLRLDDLGKAGRIFPLFDGIGGALDLDMNLTGTASDPAFVGSAKLSDGFLVQQASGLSITDVNLSGTVSESDESIIQGSFRAGEGSGEITADIEFEDILSPTVSLLLQGDSLTAIDVPDLKVVVNPDLELSWQKGLLEISGRLYVPQARISPSYLPRSSARQSEDVVIVAGELPEQETDFLQDRDFRVRGNLELELGDEVTVDLDLAQARMTGTTQFEWHDELIPMANGNYNVTGEIQAYGQLLRVTRGRIGFPDIPADNPHLNIRAEREIYGNSQIRRAGLMVAGTLRRPVIEAYTVPMTNKHRARTLLVTGSDFDFERGVGAVDVGTYIMPRLYVSYGIGVFEEGNVVSARFDLGRGFGIKATSGERETGLDLNYRFER